ncbi:6592_t:CDS:1, partial [Gigaspora margarita]
KIIAPNMTPTTTPTMVPTIIQPTKKSVSQVQKEKKSKKIDTYHFVQAKRVKQESKTKKQNKKAKKARKQNKKKTKQKKGYDT